jgi:hypothetical protein
MAKKEEKTSKQKDEERRRYIRFNYPFFIRTRKDGKAYSKNRPPLITFKEIEEDQVSIAQNVSIGGICFTTSKEHSPGSLINMEIFAPTRKAPFDILARVVWRERRDLGHGLGSTYDMGVEFLKIDSEGQFQDLLEQLVKARLEKVLSK